MKTEEDGVCLPSMAHPGKDDLDELEPNEESLETVEYDPETTQQGQPLRVLRMTETCNN